MVYNNNAIPTQLRRRFSGGRTLPPTAPLNCGKRPRKPRRAVTARSRCLSACDRSPSFNFSAHRRHSPKREPAQSAAKACGKNAVPF